MWAALDGLGVPADATILEPGCGTGGFIEQARPGQQLTGVELDPTTAGVAGLLHPEAQILNESFAETLLESTHAGFDAAIGNVPFAQTRLFDPAYNPDRLSLHNHFIVKSLRLTKPGGVVCVMTSRWTMDGKAERSRRAIAAYGELLGAVRMPAGAHGEIAGTDAMIDVLVLRRHEGEAPAEEPAWLHTVDVDGSAGQARINSYFTDHPEMVIGDVDTRLGQFGPEIVVRAEDVSAAAIAPKLGGALTQITETAVADGRVWQASGRRVTDRPIARVVQDPAQVIGHITVDESGELVKRGLEGVEPVEVPKNARRELAHLVELRDAAVALLEAEAATREDTSEIAALRSHLGSVYDQYVAQYGPLGRVSTTVRERAGKDPIITRRYPAAIRAFRQDPHFSTVVALERFNEDTGEAKKATLFTQRVVGVSPTVDRVDSPEDAIRVSLDRVGHIDVPLVAELLDIGEEEVPAALGERVFLDPSDESRYLPASEYLSGNVRAKRNVVRELAAADARFQRHLEALEAVIPEEMGPAEIDVKLGASWVGVDDVSAFIEHTLKKEVKQIERINGEWRFKLVGAVGEGAESRWGVTGDRRTVKAAAVIKMVLNGESLQLYYKDEPDGPQFLDQVGTETLQERATELHESFQDWLWADADRAERLQERYNDLYNGIVLRSYDGVSLTFPGKAATFTPRPHQHAAVARMLAEPATGLFHEVGAGKTAEMVLGVMELRRLGMVKKPAIVVPNQMLEQFTREFKQIYPRAKVLSAGSEDLANTRTRNGRKQFVARARTGDWDAVILTHGAFGRIGLGEAEAAYAKQRLDELEAVLTEKLASELSEGSVKKLEKDLASQQEKLKAMLAIERDADVSWEETGIDYLCIDEAHLFKNLPVVSKVPDLGKSDAAKRAVDLDQKLWYHREHLGQSRVATLATATPLPNSMIEMYVMMRYMRPDLLTEAEVYSADDWARQFTEQVTAVEAKPNGGGYQVKTRTTKFRNVPELLRMWHIPGDVKTQADLRLPVPAQAVNSDGVRAPEMVVVPATSEQQAGMDDLIARGEQVRSGSVDPSEDNMLKITANGRALALDARLLNGSGPEVGERTKLDVVADGVFRLWSENRDREFLDEWGEPSPIRGAFQMVFSDLGTPSSDGRWNAYDYLRNDLVERGIPHEQIAFIHEAHNDKEKAELFQRCRDGRVQVLVGSTEKMGVGTNVQARAIALHHVDAPWRPADVTQREGRIIRQGNQNDQVQVFRYATEGSFDAYMWGTLARKASFIEQVLSGRLDVREVDNSTEMALQFAEMQAVTAGDMRILELANLRTETQKLGRAHRGHLRKITSVEARKTMLEQSVRVIEHDLSVLKRTLPKVRDTRGDRFAGSAKQRSWADATVFRERKDFAQALRSTLVRSREAISYFGTHNASYPAPLKMSITVAGIEWDAALRWNAHAKDDPIVEFQAGPTHRALKHEMTWSRILNGDASHLAQRFEAKAREIPDEIAEHESRIAACTTEIEELTVLAKEPWPRLAELEEKQKRLLELIKELEAEAGVPQEDAAKPETEPGITPATNRAVIEPTRQGVSVRPIMS